MSRVVNAVSPILTRLYGGETAQALLPRLLGAIADARPRIPAGRGGEFDQRDSLLITYPDMVQESGKPPLRTLLEFSEEHLRGVVSCVHILPFFPSSSDDGFSIVDFRSVDPALGTWEDIGGFRRSFRVMIDAVFNHVSVSSAWFQGFLRDEPDSRDMFVVVPAGSDLSRVVRPRSLPLLTGFNTPSGHRLVWTTFSRDQADLNYASPAVLARIVETLMFYVERGADLVRLDAIAYIWKEVGTRCIHLPQAHLIVQLFRAILDVVAPHVALVTETNVPHEENVSYFGDGANEAQLVYNFTLPPLVLNAFSTESADALTRWVEGLSPPSSRTTFLNFLASHDGIGVVPAKGILSEADIQMLVDGTLARGGQVSFKAGPDGALSPYELNISYWDALGDPGGGGPLDIRVQRFLAAHAIMLALQGVPALYFHSLFGSSGWVEGATITGSKRAINRQKCERSLLEGELGDAASPRARVFCGLKSLLSARGSTHCFHPQAAQRVLRAGASVFAIVRDAPDGGERVLCLHNVSGEKRVARVDLGEVYGRLPGELKDIVAGRVHAVTDSRGVALEPYQVAWLQGHA